MATARMRFFTRPSLCKLTLRRMAEESGIATASANGLLGEREGNYGTCENYPTRGAQRGAAVRSGS